MTTLTSDNAHNPVADGEKVLGPNDNAYQDPTHRAPLVVGKHNFTTITETVTDLNLRKTPKAWYVAFAISNCLLLMFLYCIYELITKGVGVWGNNNPVAWGFPIVNFVFWVGIGHAGTLISAILFLFRQRYCGVL